MSRYLHLYRVIGTLGLAAGGLLGAVFLPEAVALADSYSIEPDPGSIETITGFYGPDAPPPAVPDSVQGSQLFDVVDTTTHKTIGTFDADEAYNASLYGGPNQELLVTSDVSGTVGTAAQDVPPVGSVIDISQASTGATTYYDLASKSGDVIKETGFGLLGVPGYLRFFDAAKGIGNGTVDHDKILLPDGNSVVAAPGSPEDFTAIDGDPPYDVAVQGDQLFDVDNAQGVTVGTFEADVTDTRDTLYNYTEALVVTNDVSGTPGTAAGDVLPVGSVINVFYYVYGSQTIYSDLPSASGDVISLEKSSFGLHSTSADSYDAVKALTTDPFLLPSSNDEMVPVSSMEVAGVNGLPPSDVSFQGYQQFNVVDPTTGAQLGTVDADVTTDSYATGSPDEAILVTSVVSGTPGTAAGDVPAVGSAFDVVTSGTSGIPEATVLDLATGLAADHFFIPAF
jgi:hypothetical protein